MLEINIPSMPPMQLEILVLDFNGTLATDGMIHNGVSQRIELLKRRFEIFIVTCDTFGNAKQAADTLGVRYHSVEGSKWGESSAKAQFVKSLNPDRVVVIGNGNSDVLMMQEAALSIGVMEREGISVKAMQAAHIISATTEDALDLLLFPKRVIATLRS
jgi:soluble P-type ATPase